MFNHSCNPNCHFMKIGDFMFTFVTRPVAAGDELCIGYLSYAAPFAERCRTFAEWGIDDGFECQCPKCALLRARPELVHIDARIHDARRQLGHGSTTSARERALPRLDRVQIRATLDALPDAFQPPLDGVLLLEAADMVGGGQAREALAAYQRIADIRYAARGGAFQWERIMDQFAVVMAMLNCGEVPLAASCLRETFLTNCRPFGRTPEDFVVLAMQIFGTNPKLTFPSEEFEDALIAYAVGVTDDIPCAERRAQGNCASVTEERAHEAHVPSSDPRWGISNNA